jgi:tripartite-type tricarboxylate transporter receptor subunit TctC
VAFPRLRALAAIISASLLALSAPVPVNAQSKAPAGDFYKGRNVSIIVGFSPGGSFDTYARTISRHLGRHIPGNPNVIVQNMPGAGSLKAVEYLYSVAARDGTVMATFNHTVPIEPLLGRAKFDTRQLSWIGSVANESSVCVASARSPVKSLEDLKRMPFTLGGTGRSSDTDMFAAVIKTNLGYPLRLVTGYPGTNEIMLAVQRGELDGLCGIFYSSLVVGYQDLIKARQLHMLAQAAIEPDPLLPNVPMILDYAKSERQKQILMLLIGPQAMARPYAMPPGATPANLAIMRRAFDATMTDPAFVEETRKARMPVRPIGATKILEILEQLHRTPPDVLAEAIKTFSN